MAIYDFLGHVCVNLSWLRRADQEGFAWSRKLECKRDGKECGFDLPGVTYGNAKLREETRQAERKGRWKESMVRGGEVIIRDNE